MNICNQYIKELYIIKDYVYNEGISVQIALGVEEDEGDRKCLKEELDIINGINIKVQKMIYNIVKQ